MTNLRTLNFHLLTTLGLSRDSADAVMDHIGELEKLIAREKAARTQVEASLNDALVENVALKTDVAATNAALEELRRHTEEMGAVQMKLEAAKELRDQTIAELERDNERLRAVVKRFIDVQESTAMDYTEGDWIEARRALSGQPVAVEDRPMPGIHP